MKKIIALAIALIMALTLAACGSNSNTPDAGNTTPPANTSAPTPGSQPSQTPSGTEGTPDPTPTPVDPNERGNTAGNILNGGYAAEKDGWVYYVSFDHPFKLYKMRLDGSDNTLLAENVSRGNINVVGGYVYFSGVVSGMEAVCRIPTSGQEKERDRQRLAGSFGRTGPINSMTVIGEWIYYQRPTETDLYKLKTDGSEETLLIENASYVNVVGDWIYYIADRKCYKMRTDGTSMTEITVEEPIGVDFYGEPAYMRSISRILIDGDYMYLKSNVGTMGWCRLDMDAANGIRMETNSQYFNVSGGWAYYVEEKHVEGEGTKHILYKTNIDSGETVELCEMYQIRYPNIVGDWVYCIGTDIANNHRTVLLRVRTDGTGFEILQG